MQVLLLGVGYDSNTTVHLAGVRYRRKSYSVILQAGQPVRVAYGEIDHCCQNFNLVDGWRRRAANAGEWSAMPKHVWPGPKILWAWS